MFLFLAMEDLLNAPTAVNTQVVKVVWQMSDVAGVEMIMIHVLEGTYLEEQWNLLNTDNSETALSVCIIKVSEL